MKRHVAILIAVLATLGLDPPSTADAAAGAPPTSSSSIQAGMVWTTHAVPAPVAAPGLYLGNSVAVSEGSALLGTPGDSAGGLPFAGAVHVYRKTDGVWTESQTLESSRPRESGTFGSTIAMRGAVAVIGESGSTAGANRVGGSLPQAQQHRGDAARAAYVFNSRDGIWSESARLVADDGAIGGPDGAASTFGTALAVDGNMVAVGARSNAIDPERPEQGSVYVFSDDGNGWRQVQKLTADDGRAYEHFGSAIALQGDTLLVGAKDATWRRDRPQQGAVYVYTRADGVWTQRQKLYPPEGRAASMFGQSLALDGDTALAGAYNGGATNGNGAAYVLTRANGLWSVGQKLTAQNGELFDTFGGTVALSGDRAVISAHNAWIDGTVQQGADFVFEKIGDTWVHQARLVSPAGGAYKFFGYHVAIEGRTIFSSQWIDSQAYVFEGHLPPSADFAPGEVRVALAAGASTQVVLQIANSGDEALEFELAGSAAARRVALTPRSTPPRLTASRPVAELVQTTLAQNPLLESVYGGLGSPLGASPLSFILDDGSFENRLTIPRGPDEQSTIWLNRFAAPAGTGAFTIDSLSILFPAQDLGSVVGRDVNLVAYHDADADGDPRDAVRLGSDHFVKVGAADQFGVFEVDFRVPGDGDIYVGFESSYARGGSWPLMYPAAIDTSAPAPGHSWLASTVDELPPDLGDLSGHVIQGFVEDFGVRGNWLIRASGTDAANDCISPSAVPWLALNPATGSVPASGSVAVTLTLDAGGLAEGTYTAVLCAATNDPSRAIVRVPITLSVPPDGLIFRNGFEGAP